MSLPAPLIFVSFAEGFSQKWKSMFQKTVRVERIFFFQKNRNGSPIRSGASLHFGPEMLIPILGPFWGQEKGIRDGGLSESKTFVILILLGTKSTTV